MKEASMSKLHGLLLMSLLAALCHILALAGQSKAKTRGHSAFYNDFDQDSMLALCQARFSFVKERCGTGSRGLGITWKGQESSESFKIFYLTGDLSEEEVNRVLKELKPELMNIARASKVTRAHDPKDTIIDRPMRLLQPGLIWAGTPVIPSDVRGFYFTYEEGKVEGAVDVLAVPIVQDKKAEWLVLGAVHEVAN